MARIQRWPVMIHDSLQAEFIETKYNGHIHRYGTSIFRKIVVYITDLQQKNQILWGL